MVIKVDGLKKLADTPCDADQVPFAELNTMFIKLTGALVTHRGEIEALSVALLKCET